MYLREACQHSLQVTEEEKLTGAISHPPLFKISCAYDSLMLYCEGQGIKLVESGVLSLSTLSPVARLIAVFTDTSLKQFSITN